MGKHGFYTCGNFGRVINNAFQNPLSLSGLSLQGVDLERPAQGLRLSANG